MSDSNIKFVLAKTNIPDGQLQKQLDKEFDENLSTEMVRLMPKKHGASVEAQETLVQRAKEACEAIEYLASHQKKSWFDVEEAINAQIASLRSKRSIAEFENKQLLTALGDVRRFFFDDKHQEEVKRLSEFVEVCERLQKLQTSGFLNAVADTILKLEGGAA
jgi:hypothetical protein